MPLTPQNFFLPWLMTSPMIEPSWLPRPWPPVLLRDMMQLGCFAGAASYLQCRWCRKLTQREIGRGVDGRGDCRQAGCCGNEF